MSTLNFPVSPSIGQTHTLGTKTFQWNGTAWIIIGTLSTLNSATAISLVVTTTTNSVDSSNGGAVTIAGGTAIGKDLYIGGDTFGNTATFDSLTLTADFQSVGTDSGALIVTGGIGVGGNLFIGGTLFAQGAPVLTTASFNNTPQDGTDIDIIDVGGGILEFNSISTLQSVTTRGNSTTRQIEITNNTISTSTDSGALTVAGGIGSGGTVNSTGFGLPYSNFETSLQTVSTTSATVIDSYYFSQYRTAKYIVQIDEGTGISDNCQVNELLTVAFNTGTASILSYATTFSGSSLGTFDALMTNIGTDTVVSLYYLPSDSVPKTVKLLKMLISK